MRVVMEFILSRPQFLTAANGAIFQLLFPYLLGFIFKKQGNIFGYYIGLFFLWFSMQYISWYISTAHEGLYLGASKSFLGIDGYHDNIKTIKAINIPNIDILLNNIFQGILFLHMHKKFLQKI
jgi:hypothetical protein